jgi:transcriptional regulator of acetoin/glycerol metabolism
MGNRAATSLIPRVGDEPIVSEVWERFVQSGSLPNDRMHDVVRDVVRESWRRCRSESVDPARACAPVAGGQRGLTDLRERSRELCDAARPVLDSLSEVQHESGTLIMLIDPSSTILDLDGGSRARSGGERINLAAGGCWVEEAIGTNAIGTALQTRQPVQIFGSEHYCVDVKRWTCAAAPILDVYRKTLLGAVNVSGIKETFHGHSLGLVIAAAKQIEAALHGHELELQGRLLEQAMDVFVRYPSDCVILFDQRGRMVRSNRRIHAAREMYGVRLPLEAGEQVAALDLSVPAGKQDLAAVAWLRPEWIHPLRSRRGQIGTLLVIPLTAAPAVRDIARAQTGDAAGAEPFADLIGNSAAITTLKAKARRLAPLDLPVLLLGETGVGKEVVARGIHQAGPRAAAPFVAVNCGGLTRELLASELFGYAEGAFTGAKRGGHPGKFEQADGGTLFLDEIGEMPLDLQPHLLRVLQDGVVVRVGDTRERRISVRIIAATNRDLQGEVAAGGFREDLYHRLHVTSLRLPALREIREDIPAIVQQMIRQLAAKYGRAPRTISPEVMDALLRYRWPGNVRELKNVFEAAFALGDGDLIDISQLPPEFGAANDQQANSPPSTPDPCAAGRLDDLEKRAIAAAIESCKGNLSQAAKSLGISRSTLYVKLSALKEQSVQ